MDDYKFIKASDVSSRDGIGVEIYRGDTFLMEIFRDDTDKSRIIFMPQETIELSVMEDCIRIFKDNIDWNFIEY